MRKISLAAIAIAVLCSCEKQEVREPETVSVSLDYTFVESGSMSRSGSTLYTDFYNKYIKTKILTPQNYSLTITDTKENATVATVNGIWGKNDMINLKEGDYKITGTSTPRGKAQDTISIKFSETIKVTKATTKINLTASYDCYMLFFNKSNFKELRVYHSSPYFTLSSKDNIYYTFLDFNTWSSSTPYIEGIRNNNKTITIYPRKFTFEKGKYYYFNDVTESFDVPPMTEQ